MFRGAVFLGLMTLSVAAQEQAPKPAWQWTLEERIAARTNGAQARKRAHARRVEANAKGWKHRGESADEFVGGRNPELFLPHEVFDDLIVMGFVGDARDKELLRKALKADVEKHGLPPDFWDQLRTASAVYVSDTLEVHDTARQGRTSDGRPRAEMPRSRQLETCRANVDALEAARETFGRDRFDRFLYEVIAPKMFHVALTLPDPAQLRFVAGGCR